MLEQGVAKEVARTVLPLALYTKDFWSCNPRSLLHFCGLRNSETGAVRDPRVRPRRRGLPRAADAVTHAAFVANGRIAP